MWRSPSLPPLLSIALAITALNSNAKPPDTQASSTGQCNIRLLIPEQYEHAPIEIDDATVSLQGSGPLNPFIVAINGEWATPNPIVSGCFDIHLGLESLPPNRRGLFQMLVEPI